MKKQLNIKNTLCFIVIIISMLDMLGWSFQVSELVQISKEFVPMQFNTALCLFMAALVILTMHKNRFFSFFILAILFLFIGITLLQYMVGVNLGIDEIFIKHYTKTLSEFPGRMSPNSGICFLLIIFAVTSFQIKTQNKIFIEFGKANNIAVGILSAVSLFSYLFNIDFLHSWGFVTGMALHTSLCFFLLSIGLWQSQSISFYKSYAALISAVLFSWFLFSWQYSTNRNDIAIAKLLGSDNQLLSNRISNEINSKQNAVNRLANRLSWMHSLNYHILYADIDSYFNDFSNLEFISFTTEDQRVFSFFNKGLKTQKRQLYKSVCQHSILKTPDEKLICIKSSDEKLFAVFNFNKTLDNFINIPELNNKIIEIKINNLVLFSNKNAVEPMLTNWQKKQVLDLDGAKWVITIGLTSRQLHDFRHVFPTFVFGLGATVSFLLLFIFYYINVVVIKNKKLQKTEAVLRDMVTHDALTKALNRNSALKILTQAITKAKKTKSFVHLMYIDIDDFKSINDSYGHGVGDKFLIHTYKMLKAHIHSKNTIARLGGDEFIVIISSAHINTKMIKDMANKLIQLFHQGVNIDGIEIFPTISIGLAVSIHGEVANDELIKHADTAMYAAKRQGKNGFAFYSKKTDEYLTKTALIDRTLRHCSPAYEDFYMYFQPQVLLLDEKVISFEALLRNNHEDLVGVSPEEIIYRAEKNRTIVSLGFWTIEKSIDNWFTITKAVGSNDFDLSINISPVQLAEKNIVSKVLEIVKNKKFNIKNLILEVTETAIIQNMEVCLPNIVSLKSYGVRFAIDDFGKGYSSMNYLINIPADYVKIDKDFVIHLNKKNKAIVSAIIALASKLNMKVIAEGVEKQDHLRYLQSMKCSEGQGYYFAKPMSVNEIIDYLRNRV